MAKAGINMNLRSLTTTALYDNTEKSTAATFEHKTEQSCIHI